MSCFTTQENIKDMQKIYNQNARNVLALKLNLHTLGWGTSVIGAQRRPKVTLGEVNISDVRDRKGPSGWSAPPTAVIAVVVV